MQETEDRGRHVPLTAPVVEYGFGTTLQKNLKAHGQTRDFNFFINLANASFQHLYPGMFSLPQYVLFFCFTEAQCWLSEIFITQLGQGYIQKGGGFNHYAACFSNEGSYCKVPVKKWMRYLVKAVDERLLEKVIEEGRDSVERMNTFNATMEHLQRIEDAVDEALQATADPRLAQQ